MAAGAGVTVRVRRKDFPGAARPLFQDLAFAVAPGEVVALLGPSGVGKSTLLRMIAGVEPFEGEIEVVGHPAGQGPVPGFVFQDPRLLPWRDAVGNVRAVAPGLGEGEARALLGKVGLAGFEEALPGALSGGMQRRVALARALGLGSGLLLLDEPFVSLDRALARELQDLIAQVIDAGGTTAILVSHEGEDAARLADRVIRLAGRPARVVEDRRLGMPRAARGREELRALAESLEEP